MCTFDNDPKTRRPKKGLIKGWKRSDNSGGEVPFNFMGNRRLPFGWLRWNHRKALATQQDSQSGFQVFAKKKDAYKYGWFGAVYPVYFYAKDILKATSNFTEDKRKLKVYEVSKVWITKKGWKQREYVMTF